MKKLLLVFLASALVFGCQKKDVQPVQIQQDVVFNVSNMTPGFNGLKSTTDWTWECPTNQDGSLMEPASAEIIIDDGTVETTYTPAVFKLDGKLYTQAIKLPAAESGATTYTVTKFVLYAADGTTIIMAAPQDGAPFSEYTDPDVPFTFEVNAFKKAEVPVQVLCFYPQDYSYFGFDWFDVTQIVVREFCFFGDICVKHPDEYDGSFYDNQSTGLQIDMPAIIKIVVTDKDGNEVPHNPFTNASANAGWGVGSPLCVQYPDNLQVDGEEFTFDLYVYVKQGSSFDYKWFATFKATDDGGLMDADGNPVPDVGQDGIVDFVLGSCNYSDTDVQLPPYQNLPNQAYIGITYEGSHPGYWVFDVQSVSPTGTYDFGPGTYDGWCADEDHYIGHQTGTDYYTFYVFSSLYPDTWPSSRPAYLTAEKMNQINWLFNHLQNWGFTMSTMSDAQGTAIQHAVWRILKSTWGDANMYYTAAVGSSGHDHENYKPLPGGYAAVLLFTNDENGNYTQQLLFLQVDP